MNESRYKPDSCNFYELILDLNKYIIKRYSEKDEDFYVQNKIKYYTNELEKCIKRRLYTLPGDVNFMFNKIFDELQFIIKNPTEYCEYLHPKTVSVVYKVFTDSVVDYIKSGYSHAFRYIYEKSLKEMKSIINSEDISEELRKLLKEDEEYIKKWYQED